MAHMSTPSRSTRRPASKKNVPSRPLEVLARVRNLEQRQRNLLDMLRRAIRHDRSNNRAVRLVTAAYRDLNAEKMRLLRRVK